MVDLNEARSSSWIGSLILCFVADLFPRFCVRRGIYKCRVTHETLRAKAQVISLDSRQQHTPLDVQAERVHLVLGMVKKDIFSKAMLSFTPGPCNLGSFHEHKRNERCHRVTLTPRSKFTPLIGINCETSWSSRHSAHPLLQPPIRSMAYNNQNVFLRTSSSTVSLGGRIREGVLGESEIGKKEGLTLIPKGIAARIAWPMLVKV